MGPEAKIEAALIKAVIKAGGLTRKLNGTGYRHFPDRLVVLPGITAFIEVKARGKRPTSAQRHLHALLRLLDAHVYVLSNTDDIPDLMQQLGVGRGERK